MENYTFIVHRAGESKDELYHHGIKGQRWGVRRYQNKDGTLTDAGKKRYADTWVKERDKTLYGADPAKTFKKAGLPTNEIDNITKNMRLTSDAINENAKILRKCAKEAEELMKDYYKDGDKYATIAGIAESCLGGFSTTKMDDVANIAWFYAYEDGDQGLINSKSVYAREKNLVDKAKDIVNRETEARANYLNECKEQVANILGVYGDRKVSEFGTATVTSTLNSDIVEYNLNKLEKETNYSTFSLNEACMWPRGSDSTNNAVQKATNIANKIDYSNGNLWYMYEAVENLGLTNIDMDDMTDRQWKELNAEMNRLNKGGPYR